MASIHHRILQQKQMAQIPDQRETHCFAVSMHPMQMVEVTFEESIFEIFLVKFENFPSYTLELAWNIGYNKFIAQKFHELS